jgi:hypothetical protein
VCDRIERAIERLEDDIFCYYCLAAIVAAVALGVLIVSYIPDTLLTQAEIKCLALSFLSFSQRSLQFEHLLRLHCVHFLQKLRHRAI